MLSKRSDPRTAPEPPRVVGWYFFGGTGESTLLGEETYYRTAPPRPRRPWAPRPPPLPTTRGPVGHRCAPPPGRQQGSASPRQRARPCPAPLTPRRAHRSHTSGTGMERGRRGLPPGPPPPTEPGAQPGNTWRGPEIASRVGGAAQARGQRPLQGGFGGPQGRVVSWEGAGAFSCVSWRPLRG